MYFLLEFGGFPASYVSLPEGRYSPVFPGSGQHLISSSTFHVCCFFLCRISRSGFAFGLLVGCLVTLPLWTLREAEKFHTLWTLQDGKLLSDNKNSSKRRGGFIWTCLGPHGHPINSAILKPPNKTHTSQPKKQPLKTSNKTLPHFSIYLHSIPLGKDPWRTTPISLGLSWPLTELASKLHRWYPRCNVTSRWGQTVLF